MVESKKTAVNAKKSQKDEGVAGDSQSRAKAKASNVERPTSNLAKAGKRSAKAVDVAEKKLVKEELKKVTSAKEAIAEKSKPILKSPRSRAERAGKAYRKALELIDAKKTYNLSEAVDLAARTNPSKFDASVEMHINLAVDPKAADQNVRGTVVLPNGTGRATRVAVFAEGDEATKAKKAGADIVGSDEFLAKLEKGQIDFEVLISTPAMMPKLGKYAKLLGPKRLMPNSKSGTVTNDITKSVTEAKAGRVEYRVDESGIIHLSIGKVSFGPAKLLQNAEALLSSVRAAKPLSIKGTYLKSAYLTSSMGPSIKTEL